MKITLRDFIREFGTNEQCLEHLRRLRWPDGITCAKCERVTPHYLIAKRKCYSCQHCGTQTYPTAGTIFHKSRVPLPDWFYVCFQFAKTRAGFSAKQVERELGVSYPTALRICNQIRSCLAESPRLSGVVEADEVYIGGRPRVRGVSKRGRGTKKVPVVGVLQRDGSVAVRVTDTVSRATVLPFIREHVAEGATVCTDELNVYTALPAEGYEHEAVGHATKQYVRVRSDGFRVHTNSLEGFWSYPKSAILRIHRGVSRRKLPGYLAEHAFRYNRRKSPDSLFSQILGACAAPVQPSA